MKDGASNNEDGRFSRFVATTGSFNRDEATLQSKSAT